MSKRTLDIDSLWLDKGSHDDPAKGMCVMDRSAEVVTRFWQNVRIPCQPEECWEWAGYRQPNGYGVLNIGTRHFPAHRLSLAIHGAPVPDGLDTCHTCDNRGCVNPHHLYAGTRRQNMADCSERGRHNKPKGAAHWAAKLTDADVRIIRRRHVEGERQTTLAREFGVHPATVSRIVRGVWRAEVES
jgi:hypothetical protein